MSYFRRFFIWICLPLLFSSCYNMHVEIGNADKYYYDNTASKESNLNICPLENIKIHCSILGGVERYDTDKNEFIGTVVEYEIRL